MKGAQGFKKKTTPFIDLFRHLKITHRFPSKSDLITIREAELVQSFESIASKPAEFKAANWLCDFTSRNTEINDNAPNLFLALKTAFSRLSSCEINRIKPNLLGVCFVLLSDHGVLPDFSNDSNSRLGVKKMLTFALNPACSPPSYSEDTWDQLWHWLKNYVNEHTSLTMPKVEF